MSTGSSGSSNLNSGYQDIGNIAQNFAPWFSPTPYPNTGPAATGAYNDISSGWSTNVGGTGNYAGQPWSPTLGGNVLGNQLYSLGNSVGDMNKLFPALSAAGSGFLGQAGDAKPAIGFGTAQYNALAPYVSQIMNTGFDPQSALYNRTFAQNEQQTLGSEAAQGVANTPYGAGITAQANENFNIDWQNAQLARQAEAAQAAGGLSTAAMGDLSSGYGTAANYANTMGTLGSNLFGQGINAAGMKGNLIGQEGQVNNQGMSLAGFPNSINQQQLSDFLSYLQSSGANVSSWLGSAANLLNAGTGAGSTLNTADYYNNLLSGSALSGLGSLAGLGLGGYLSRPSS